MKIPKTHPRYQSLLLRERISQAHNEGMLAESGMIAHGRGEAFDYLLGETTNKAAVEAIEASAATLLMAKYPVISVNGNTAALAAEKIVELANIVNALIEINLFYRTPERVEKIEKTLKNAGAKHILGVEGEPFLPLKGLKGPRSRIDPNGVALADVVMVPLEDGDRAQALIENQKKVITIDLNPLSRTSQISTITIVDNIVRALPLLIRVVKKLKLDKPNTLKKIIDHFDNQENLRKSLHIIQKSFNGDVKK
jgi:4-phosphopantoate--beta-alanine ligase